MERIRDTIVPLVMCGGAGTRLWPLSREAYPTQFIGLFGARSIFQDTLLRVSDERLFARPIVVTYAAYRFIVLEQLAELGLQADILLEPMRRNSGPAIIAGAAFAHNHDVDAIVLALSTDHLVKAPQGFVAACETSLHAAREGRIVTFGVKPERNATEYGYISPGEAIDGDVRAVTRFVEKPEAAAAASYMRQGYLWNSGNLMFRADVLLDEYRKTDPASVDMVERAVALGQRDLAFFNLEKDAFEAATSMSIDYAVMEKTARAAVIPVSFGWSDASSWHAVWESSEKDVHGNVARGPAVFENSHNCNVSSDGAVVALEGVDDLVVVSTADAVLVSRQNKPDELKRLVAQLKVAAPRVTEAYLRVHRPWGSYRSLDTGDRHHVKRIVVKAGERLSLQKHYHRSEHWVVVRGTALVTLNYSEKMVHENESIYIPIGVVHRLENPGKIPLELIEVQTGSYLDEDDIIRIDDDYQRS